MAQYKTVGLERKAGGFPGQAFLHVYLPLSVSVKRSASQIQLVYCARKDCQSNMWCSLV